MNTRHHQPATVSGHARITPSLAAVTADDFNVDYRLTVRHEVPL